VQLHDLVIQRDISKRLLPLSSIDRLVNGVSSFQVLSFLDAYFSYNQIQMYSPDTYKTAFMKDGSIYYYQVMSFSLKNIGTTYQRFMDMVFVDHTGRNLEVYMDNMVVKSTSPEEHIKDLEEIFAQFLGFMLTHRGIEANLDKCDAIIKMKRRLTLLSRFMSRVAEKKPTSFHWNDDYVKVFQDLKQFLASPPVLTRSVDGQDLYLYLAVSMYSINVVVVHEQDASRGEVRILDDRKTCPCSSHRDLTATPLFPLSYDDNSNRPPYPTGVAKTQVGWKDGSLLFEFSLKFEPRGAIKTQALANFLVEMTSPPSEDLYGSYTWMALQIRREEVPTSSLNTLQTAKLKPPIKLSWASFDVDSEELRDYEPNNYLTSYRLTIAP
ncbi:hypothetical protein CR513_23331, partial [Mucuna pruriens]